MRRTAYPKLMPACLKRWSPRAFSTEALTEEEVGTLFEAARWAPSCFNEQPWRFVYAQEQSAKEQLLSALATSNQEWARRAPLLVVVFSYMFFQHEEAPNRWAAFDTGSAWMSLAYQAQHMGLVTHAMGAFDEEVIYQLTGVDPEQYVAMAVVAVGRPGDPNALPPQLREREQPSERVPLADIVFEFQSPHEQDGPE
jgi:nitroreductase